MEGTHQVQLFVGTYPHPVDVDAIARGLNFRPTHAYSNLTGEMQELVPQDPAPTGRSGTPFGCTTVYSGLPQERAERFGNKINERPGVCAKVIDLGPKVSSSSLSQSSKQ